MEPTLMVASSRPGFGVRATLRWRELDSNHRFLSKPEVFLPRYVSGYRDRADISRRGSRHGSALLLLRLEPLHRTELRGSDALDDLLVGLGESRIGEMSIVVAFRSGLCGAELDPAARAVVAPAAPSLALKARAQPRLTSG